MDWGGGDDNRRLGFQRMKIVAVGFGRFHLENGHF